MTTARVYVALVEDTVDVIVCNNSNIAQALCDEGVESFYGNCWKIYTIAELAEHISAEDLQDLQTAPAQCKNRTKARDVWDFVNDGEEYKYDRIDV